MKIIHAENSLDLSEEPSQKSEIFAAHPNEAYYHFWNELLFGRTTPTGVHRFSSNSWT
jgi:hypothetical protein